MHSERVQTCWKRDVGFDMSIIGCEHHTGMGLCSDCSKEAQESVERMATAMRKREELMEASRVASKYNLHDAARVLREAAGR